MTFAELLKRVRGERHLTQEQLGLVVDLTKTTITLLETTQQIPQPPNARALLLALAAETPLTEHDCAWWLELTKMSGRSKDGVLDEVDRAKMRDLGVIEDPARDPSVRSILPAFSTYGPRIARIRNVGVGDVFAQRNRDSAKHDHGRQYAHELVDAICDHGHTLYLLGELGRIDRELKQAAAARAAPNEAVERASPPPIVPDVHTAYPGTGRVVTEYSPEGQASPPPHAPQLPPPAAAPPTPARPKARRKSG